MDNAIYEATDYGEYVGVTKKEIKQFANDFVELWLTKYRKFERQDLLDVLIEIINNKDAKYFKLEKQERESWLRFAIVKLSNKLKNKTDLLLSREFQEDALYREITDFDDSDLSENEKQEIRKTIRMELDLAELMMLKDKASKINELC